jgi:hypothetical protein
MKINYIETPSGKKLFSFHRHDYKSEEGVSIDGGFSYTKVSGKPIPEIKSEVIRTLIQDIREQFIWGNNFDKDFNLLPETQWILLKDLETAHIINILIYFTKTLDVKTNIIEEWKSIHYIFLEELYYREHGI